MTKSVVILQQANHGHLCIRLIHFSSWVTAFRELPELY